MGDAPRAQLSWKRPSTIRFPNIWDRFEATTKDGKICRLRIQDITEDRFDEVIRFMEMYFDNYESLNNYVKVLEDEESMMAKRYVRRKILEQKLSVMVIPDEESSRPTLAACYFLFVDLKSDQPSIKVKGRAWEQCKKVFHAAEGDVDPFQIFNSDRYLNEYGVCVSPEFRRMGIAHRIFLAQSKIAKAFQLPGFAGIFTSSYSQTIAKKLGFQLLNELVFEDYKDENGRVICQIENPKSLLYFGVKYN